jgi:hypothetical protein
MEGAGMTFKYGLMGLSIGLAMAVTVQAQTPRVDKIGDEEYVSSAFMERPHVATDSKNQPHFVCDAGGDTRFMRFQKVGGVWSGGIFAVGSPGGKYNASRLYVGQIEIDAKDRAWISCKYGAKKFGQMGQGVWLFGNVAKNPNPPELFFKPVNVHRGMGAINIDPKYVDQGVVIGSFSNFEKLDSSGNSMETGSFGGGPGGEKVRSKIAPYAPRFPEKADTKVYKDGNWHVVMNGSSILGSTYQSTERYKAGLGYVVWADQHIYPEMGNDFHHPGIGIDSTDPRVCYMGQVFNDGLCINVWDGDKLLFDPKALKILGYDARLEIRHGPAMASAPANTPGVFIFWTSLGHIKMCYLSKKGVPGAIRDIGPGVSPGATTDRDGNIHLVYNNGGIKYRKIMVSSLNPLAPKGRVTNTRTPTFRWTDARASSYTIELTQDGTVSMIMVPGGATTWKTNNDLAIGDYSWRVKTGSPASAAKWSQSAEFVIPPDMPVPAQPAGRLAELPPTTPNFQWEGDPGANSYKIELYTDAGLMGSLVTTGDVKSIALLTAAWTNDLGAGAYTWRMRAARLLTGHSVGSDWTPAMTFSIGVPGPASLTNPVPSQAFGTGTTAVPCGWTTSEGADSYELKALRNGSGFADITGFTGTDGVLNGAFTPGYYSLFVRGVNTSGNGPWSTGVTVIVRREMVPNGGAVLDHTPKSFRWTRSVPATQYLFKLFQLNKNTGVYDFKREAWIPQPATGNPKWTPSYIIPDGKYRWSITDYKGSKQGYTQTAAFQIKNSGHATWNDPALIVGTWKVLSSWRWVKLVFNANGVVTTIQGDGASFNRARWSADGEILTMVSDVTEKCPYTVTETTLTFTVPSGNVRSLVRIP